MNSVDSYINRRNRLRQLLGGDGLILFLGNQDSPMNYAANTYPFRQDSNFLYFYGIDQPGLAAIIDLAEGTDTIYGDESTLDDIVWTGPVPSLKEQAERAGISRVSASDTLKDAISAAVGKGREVHFLPPYRPENSIKIWNLLSILPSETKSKASVSLVRAIISLRSIKSAEEITSIETAVNLTGKMHLKAMEMARPGVRESEIVGALEEIVHSAESRTSFPIILSRDGQILHNHHHHHILKAGDLLLCDCGAESSHHYAGDMTRTFPVSPTFSGRQKAVYETVLAAQVRAAEMLRPGITYREVHLSAARVIAEGMKSLGLMKGDMGEAVALGAHALFFPHGLGHMMGLDVHDMEDLGENYVGYTDSIVRSSQFGLQFLRLGKELEEGFVLTVEPGVYFIPELTALWKQEKKFPQFINYDKVETFLDFGGIRIEEDFLITATGSRLLGEPVAKSVAAVEAVKAG